MSNVFPNPQFESNSFGNGILIVDVGTDTPVTVVEQKPKRRKARRTAEKIVALETKSNSLDVHCFADLPYAEGTAKTVQEITRQRFEDFTDNNTFSYKNNYVRYNCENEALQMMREAAREMSNRRQFVNRQKLDPETKSKLFEELRYDHLHSWTNACLIAPDSSKVLSGYKDAFSHVFAFSDTKYDEEGQTHIAHYDATRAGCIAEKEVIKQRVIHEFQEARLNYSPLEATLHKSIDSYIDNNRHWRVPPKENAVKAPVYHTT